MPSRPIDLLLPLLVRQRSHGNLEAFSSWAETLLSFFEDYEFKDVARVFVPSIPLAATSACPEPVEGRWSRRPRLQGHKVFLDRGAIRQLGNIRQYLSLPFVRR